MLTDAVLAAVRSLVRDGHKAFVDVITDLPDEALDWSPVPDGTPMSGLIAHALDAERALLHNALDRPMPRDRDAQFRVRFPSVGSALARITEVEAEIDALLDEVTPAHLTAEVVRWRTATGAWWLLHVLDHSREHAGQVQLLRDLWLHREAGPA